VSNSLMTAVNDSLSFSDQIFRRTIEGCSLVNDVAHTSLPPCSRESQRIQITNETSRFEPNENRDNRALASPSNETRERSDSFIRVNLS
jgi:hypothetical protein